MSFAERLHLTRAETFYAVVLPLLGAATVVSLFLSLRTAPGFLTWSGSVIDAAMFVSIEAVLIKVLRTSNDDAPAISTQEVIDLIVGAACVVIVGAIAAIVATRLLNGNERTINDDITAMAGLLLIFISAGLSMSQRSRLNRPREAG